ncbi:hypothetical protein IMG5_001360 [Ichthyophthirius multifiliis]|uniref:Uncharacterized protein n=1 Tax=Ichthyophthirius multifiliis TaxID=5932 RepID=G0QIS8_ICHMU|nr:hypothetical protein IMG5_001360 [Ichthyophthirius multifiliis]EGR34907.1 hypothetical protein IMG5_001360 [Ichthyophthirius multifiliis]|eukprot:XP_004040211.1 hypothetical protein IMG5_001360 [Ichthyophthirius multifiliis]
MNEENQQQGSFNQEISNQQEQLNQNCNNEQYVSSLNDIELSNEFKKTGNYKYIKTYQELAREKEIYEYQNAKKKSYINVKAITTDQIQGITSEINNFLSLKKVNLDQILDQYFFTEQVKKRGTISIQEIINVLQADPFNLSDNQSIQLSRYLIEDNTQDEIKFKKNMDASNVIVRSRIKFAIGRLKLFTPEKEIEINKQITEILIKHGELMKFTLCMIGDVKKTYKCTKEQILRCMKTSNIELSSAQQDYYFLKLYENSNTPGKFNLEDTTALFVKQQEKSE